MRAEPASTPAPQRRGFKRLLGALALLLAAQAAWALNPVHERLMSLLDRGTSGDDDAALAWLSAYWKPDYAPMTIDALRFVPDEETHQALVALLHDKAGAPARLKDWGGLVRWQWTQPAPGAAYADFKSLLHRQIDKHFREYFSAARSTRIRLDEVVWGGVRQDGIPPLRGPKMLPAREATYLSDSDVVFAIDINGDARAYPKRVLAWHEMFVDKVGGVDVAGVYCTLCGAMVLYQTRVGATQYELGTSGFLYRSNKLMYDKATQSLWSTLEGEPVIGPLVGKGIKLPVRSVVTSTWSEWRRRHPQTTVLSLDTGHDRDYGEGVAYREYFETDLLMFPVPDIDSRLANKQEVLLPRFGKVGEKPLAISSAFLKKHPVYAGRYGGQDYVVLTDGSGAHRIYALPPGLTITRYDGADRVTDSKAQVWKLDEAKLTREGAAPMLRLPSHNAFWFGWRAAFPDTQLLGYAPVANSLSPPISRRSR